MMKWDEKGEEIMKKFRRKLNNVCRDETFMILK